MPTYNRRLHILGKNPWPCPVRAREVSVRAHLDVITFKKPAEGRVTPELQDLLLKLVGNPRFKHPRKRTEDWLALHDPTPTELSQLVNAYWWGELIGLEIAVDLHPRGIATVPELERVRGYLRHGLVPHQSPHFEKVRRTFVAARRRKPQRDLISNPMPAGTIYWTSRKGYAQLKLYRKTLDQGRSVARPWIRVETAFNRGGCQDIDVRRIGRLPYLLDNARRIVGTAFTVARGVKFRPTTTKSRNPRQIDKIARKNRRIQKARTKGFSSYGGTWCAQAGIPAAPDAVVGRAFGTALHGLKRRFKKVQFDAKKRKQIEAFLATDVL